MLKADYSRNTLTISVYNIFRKRSIPNTNLRKIIARQEKTRAIGLKGASSRALDP